MKVLYYTDQIYLHGGLERVLANKLNYLSHHTAMELHVLTFQQEKKAPCYDIDSRVVFHDIQIDYNRELSFFHPQNLKYVFKHFSRLRHKIKAIEPDVIVVCNYEFGYYFMPLISKKSINIKEYHSSNHFNFLKRKKNKSFFKRIINKMNDYTETKYDYLVLLNSDEIPYYHSQNKIVIPNSLTFFPDKQAPLKNTRALSAGRIAPVKGYENLIKVWQLVHQTHPHWILDIYGDGEDCYVTSLKNQIKVLGLDKTIHIHKATDALQNEMLNTSIYVMSSHTECFPMVLLEAMSCGLPVVSFDCPHGPRHIITHGKDGLLIEPNDIEAMAKGIVSLIEQPGKRTEMGKHAIKNIERFEEERVMGDWIKLFSSNQPSLTKKIISNSPNNLN